jgi:hypothetical protein
LAQLHYPEKLCSNPYWDAFIILEVILGHKSLGMLIQMVKDEEK